MNTPRTPSETRSRRAWSRWRACRCSLRLPASARSSPAAAPAAAWKAELLAAAGAARRRVCAGADARTCRASPARQPRGSIALHRARNGAARISTAPRSRSARSRTTPEAAAFARGRAPPAYRSTSIDKPAFCDFAFGAIVNRSPLVVGISTDGAAPVFGQAIRARIEAMLPRGFARWAEAARQWRGAVRRSRCRSARGADFWERFTERALAQPDRDAGPATIYAAAGRDAQDVPERARLGHPGRRRTGRSRAADAAGGARAAVRRRDPVSTISSRREVLDFARREAKKMLVGKTGHGPSCQQDDINALMVELAHRRQARGAAEGRRPDDLRPRRRGDRGLPQARGIPVEVVPGISAAQGAAARLGVSLTHRALARRLQYVTGHDRGGELPADIDWRALADPSGDDRRLHAPANARTAARDRDRARPRTGHTGGGGRQCDASRRASDPRHGRDPRRCGGIVRLRRPDPGDARRSASPAERGERRTRTPHRLIWQAAPGHALPRFLGRGCEADVDFSLSPEQQAIREAIEQRLRAFRRRLLARQGQARAASRTIPQRLRRRRLARHRACPKSTAARASASPRRRS